MQNVIEILKERGFIESMTSEELASLAAKPLKVYCGFDPTGDSLHLGNMVAIMGLAWFERCGHTPVAIVGGATGMIGDPSGKTSERQLLDEATIDKNLIGIRRDLEKLIKKPVILNNYDWFKSFSWISFLREVGKHFRIGTMLAKESVKNRMTTEEGMSFTEFCYQILQAYDFLYLFDQQGVTVQLGGSDQWGNITAGTELIRRLRGQSAFGLTFPLLTRSDGQKFGKSEKGAIWLSSEKLSPYEFYQYLFRVSDEDAIKLMRMLTFMEMAEIRHFEHMMKKPDYVPNTAQKRLAEEVTRLVHGEEGLKVALKVTAGAAPGAETALDAEVLESLAADMPSHALPVNEIVGAKLIDVMAKTAMMTSKGEARRLIRNGGVYLNNVKIANEDHVIGAEQLIDGRLLLLALGK
ncbi:MAG: tyrosine--tRNA ligase, partial [Parachlamydia sp.]|nr:tyrosine--tRNA ligase [Parachlamydia sp.]